MPFKKTIVETTQTNAQLESEKKGSFSAEGLNESNVKSFEVAKLTPQQEKDMQAKIQSQTSQVEQHTKQTLNENAKRKRSKPEDYKLSMPKLEDIPKPTDQMTVVDDEIAKQVIVKIWDCLCYNEWYPFFTQQTLQETVNRATRHNYRMLMELYNIPTIDAATDLAVLCLVDVVIVGDDSSSMLTTGNRYFTGEVHKTEDFEEGEGSNNNMSRWDLLGLLIQVGSFVTTLFDSDGISVRFLNKDHRQSAVKMDNVASAKDVKSIFTEVKPNGGTLMGGTLIKVFEELVEPKLTKQSLSKPVLVWVVTDGQSGDDVTQAIRMIRKCTKKSKYGSRAMLFSFSQVGNDANATKALKDMDEDDDPPSGPEEGAGDITDCTSCYKIEKQEYDEAQKLKSLEERVPYTEYFHLIKTYVGPMLAKYDKADETKKTK